MPTFPVTVIDYQYASGLLKRAVSVLDQSKTSLTELRGFVKSYSRLEKDSDALDGDLEGTLDGYDSLGSTTAPQDLDPVIDQLEEFVRHWSKEVTRLTSVAEQAEAWEKHFSKQWQKLFLQAYDGDPDVKMSKDQLEESFLEAISHASPKIEWHDSKGVLTLDLERAFKHQQAFQDPEERETQEAVLPLTPENVLAAIETNEASTGRAVIADVRAELDGTFEEQTRLLKQMQIDGMIVLMKDDSPRTDPRWEQYGVPMPGAATRVFVYRDNTYRR